MFGKAITYKTTTKGLADNRTTKYEASIGPAESLSASVRQISKTLMTATIYVAELFLKLCLAPIILTLERKQIFLNTSSKYKSNQVLYF